MTGWSHAIANPSILPAGPVCVGLSSRVKNHSRTGRPAAGDAARDRVVRNRRSEMPQEWQAIVAVRCHTEINPVEVQRLPKPQPQPGSNPWQPVDNVGLR